MLVLLAYSHGMYIVMSSIPVLSLEHSTIGNVMYEFLLVGYGASSKMSSEDIEKEIEKVGMNLFWFKFLFTSYIIVTLVGLLNFIIASMCDS